MKKINDWGGMRMFTVQLPTHNFTANVFLLFFSVALAPFSMAVNDRDLWLPASYKHLVPEFRKSALKLEETERCVRVISGKLKESTARTEPVFILKCKNRDNKNYVALVNSKSLEINYPNRDLEAERDAKIAQIEADRIAEIARLEAEEIARLEAERIASIQSKYEECDGLYKAKTRYMKNMKELSRTEPDPAELSEGKASMVFDFDAVTLQGKKLNYRATCHIDFESPTVVKIKGRKDS